MLFITVLKISILSNVCMVSGTDSRQSVNDKRNFKWTPKLDAIVLRIFDSTNLGEGSHSKRIKEEWDRILPQFKNVQASTLRRHAINLFYKDGESSKGSIQWTPKLKSDLLEMYHHAIESGGKTPALELHSMFYTKHKELTHLAPTSLWSRAKVLLDSHRTDGKTDQARRNVSWKIKYADDLIRIYHQYPNNHRNQARRLHEEWVKLHPEHRHIKPHVLQTRMREITRTQTEGKERSVTRYKWTRQNNADLLHIYHRIEPGKGEYTARLRERWSRMYPDLKYMKRDHLRRQVIGLVKKHYEPTETEKEEARAKFDNLPPPKNVETPENKSHGVDKGKTKIGLSREQTTFMSPQRQDSRSPQFYDSMSANQCHRRSPGISRENNPCLFTSSNNWTPYYNSNEVPNHINYHHGEKNPSQKPQPENPLELFFDFL